jgi:hypothetical protein
MKVGDLVRIGPHCVNRGRLGIVTRVGSRPVRWVWIAWADGGEGNGDEGQSLIRNLELLNESR